MIVNVVKDVGEEPSGYGVSVASFSARALIPNAAGRLPRHLRGKVRLADEENREDWTDPIEIPSVLIIDNPLNMNEVRRAVRKAFQNQDGHLIPVVFYESRFGLVRIYNLRHTLDGQPLELTVPLDIRGEEEEEEGERAPAPAYTTTSRPQGGLAPSSAPVVVAVTNLPATTPSATPLGASAPVAMVSLGTKLLLLHWTSPLLFVLLQHSLLLSNRCQLKIWLNAALGCIH